MLMIIRVNNLPKTFQIQRRNFQIFSSHHIYDALRDLGTFALFKKREKHPWRSVTFSKVAGF